MGHSEGEKAIEAVWSSALGLLSCQTGIVALASTSRFSILSNSHRRLQGWTNGVHLYGFGSRMDIVAALALWAMPESKVAT